MPVDLLIPELGDKFKDYRQDIPGDSFNWGPVITPQNIQYLFFHHSVTKQIAKNDGNWKAECDYIANLHIKPEPYGRGWGGVGYRLIICSDGTVAYVGDLSRGGSAVGGNNHIIFSVCLVGDFTKELPTAAQVHSAHLLAKHFLFNMPQYPNLNGWEDVFGHQDAANILRLAGAEPTACPGSNWRVQGDNLRDRIINDKWQGYPVPEPVTNPAPPADQPTIPNPKITDSTKIPVNGKWGILEVQQIRSILNDQDRDLTEEKRKNGVISQTLDQARTIIYGKGWPWSKISQLKTLIK